VLHTIRSVIISYVTARVSKQVCSTSLYHSGQWCIILKPRSNRMLYDAQLQLKFVKQYQ